MDKMLMIPPERIGGELVDIRIRIFRVPFSTRVIYKKFLFSLILRYKKQDSWIPRFVLKFEGCYLG